MSKSRIFRIFFNFMALKQIDLLPDEIKTAPMTVLNTLEIEELNEYIIFQSN